MKNTKIFAQGGNKIMHNVRWFLLSLTLGLFLGGGLIAVNAWTDPDPLVAPPGGNVGAPINTSSVMQIKNGNIMFNGVVASGVGNTLLVPLGNVGIGDNTPDIGTGGQLKLDVAGNIGATRYCDAAGSNCKAITEMGGIFTKSFDSGKLAITASSVRTVNHGLGTSPKLWKVVLVNEIAELGYSPGDEVEGWTRPGAIEAKVPLGFVNSTQIGYIARDYIFINRKDSPGDHGAINYGRWKIVLRAWN